MHFALNIAIRTLLAVVCVAIAWVYFHLPSAAAFSLAQAVFLFSFVIVQPDWRALLGAPYLLDASSKITDTDRQIACGSPGSGLSCHPSIPHQYKKAIEIEFCLRRVESSVAKLDHEI